MKRRSTLTLVLALLALPIGAFLVRAGDLDDSPGLGGIGLIIGLLGVIHLVRLAWRHLKARREVS